jgi:hypothetical protein
MQNGGNVMETREYQWKLYEEAMKKHQWLSERQWDQCEKFDKFITTIAAGFFGVSFAFVDKIVPLQYASHLVLLAVSWGCFALCLVTEAISFRVSASVHGNLAGKTTQNYLLQIEGKLTENKAEGDSFDSIAACNYSALLLFIGGFICFLLFVLLNFLKM